MVLLAVACGHAATEEPRPPLYAAVNYDGGGLAKVKELLAAGADLHQTWQGKGLVACAVASFGPRTAIYLLEQGAPAQGATGSWNALQWAAWHASESADDYLLVAKALLDRGFDANSLGDAATQAEFAQLKAKGQKNDYANWFSPLRMAATRNCRPLVELLLARGADRQWRGLDGKTAADGARADGYALLADLIEGRDPAGYRASLYYAAECGDAARVKQLLAGGADARQVEPLSGRTALHAAARCAGTRPSLEHGVCATLLLAAGTPVDAAEVHGWTALLTAAAHQNSAVAQVLVNHGANPNYTQPSGCASGYTPFDWALEHRDTALALLMVDHGATPGERSKLGFTLGRDQREVELWRSLTQRGLKPTLAVLTKLCERYVLPLYGAQRLPCYKEVLGVVLAANPALATARSATGQTALHAAAAAGNTLAVELLLAAGADALARDAQGRTALALAQANQHSDTAQRLGGAAAAPTPAAPAAAATVPPLSADEQLAVRLLNADRAAQGLPALVADPALAAVARAHAADMLRRHYFDHKNPEGQLPWDRLTAAGLKHGRCGENIALNGSVEGAQRAWMNSPGHRANILSDGYRAVGVGIAGQGHSLYLVQLFNDQP